MSVVTGSTRHIQCKQMRLNRWLKGCIATCQSLHVLPVISCEKCHVDLHVLHLYVTAALRL